jgi:cytochrome P450
MGEPPTRKYDLYSQAFFANAYRTFAQMREDDPVLLQPGLDGKTPIWFVSRYDDVAAILLDDERFVRDARTVLTAEELDAAGFSTSPVFQLIENHMLNKDRADHRRLRRLVTKAFTPRMVERLRPRVEEIAGDLLDRVQDRGRMDVVEDYAFPLPIIVIAELLGIPAADRGRFREWSNAVVTPDLSPDALDRFLERMSEFTNYLRALFAERRASPRHDLITALLQAEEAGDSLSEPELFSMVVLLIVAGHETTVGLIGNAVLTLLRQSEHMAALRDDPDRIPETIEEILRYDGPVDRALNRWAAEDVEVGDKLIRRGDSVIVLLNSANHDPARFEAPEAFSPERTDNRHIAFGRGPHYCLGAPLARLEADVALRTLLLRLPTLRLATDADELRWREVPLFRSLTALAVEWN